MKRGLAALALVALLAAAGTAALVWHLTRAHPPELPQISVYSHGHLARVGPYKYCLIAEPTNCQTPATQGELPVNARDAVQISVPTQVARAPWRLLRTYENPGDTTFSVFLPNERLAVTVPTVDPDRGRLTGVAVQRLALTLGPDGEIGWVPHAEWSVGTVWA